MPWRGVLLAAVFAVLAVPMTAAAAVQMPGRVITVWHDKDGAPSDIGSLAQTPDGWIWLGTSGGLFRFDGRRFYAHDLIGDTVPGPRNISALTVDREGGLWAVYSARMAVHRALDGVVTIPPGLPDEPIGPVVFDAQGTPMVSAGERLFALVGGRWVERAEPAWTPPVGKVHQAFVDARHSLIVSADGGLFVLPQGSTRFTRLQGVDDPAPDLFVAGDGALWRWSGDVMRPVGGERIISPQPGRDGTARALADPRGGLWLQTAGCDNFCYRPAGPLAGLSRVAEADGDRFPKGPDGLLIVVIMSDAEGAIWVGGKEGLARIRPGLVSPVRHDGGANYFATAPLGSGRMLVGTDTESEPDALWVHGPEGVPLVNLGSHPAATMSLGADGSVLIGGQGHLARYRNGVITPEAVPARFGDEIIHQVLAMPGGDVWVSVRHHGLYRVAAGTWTQNGGIPGLPADWPLSLVADGQGGMLAGYRDGQLFAVGRGARALGGAVGSGLGTVSAILPGLPLLAGGERGVAWYDGERFHPIVLRMQGVLRGVTGLARGRNGDVWINARGGLIRLRAADIAATAAGQAEPLSFDVLDGSVGMPGGSQQVRPLPTIVPDGQGRLWAAMTSGLVVVPDDITVPHATPFPAILSMETGAQTLSRLGGRLSPDETMLAVTYTGLSLVDPARIQFRFRLKGVDDGWRYADGPGNVQYAKLPPGVFHFEIQARGTRGDWSQTLASGPIERSPTLVETTWFHMLLALAAGAMLIALYLLRVRIIQHRAAERVAARLAERDRIARELHDSMLQGMMGIALRLEAWGDDARMPAWLRPGLAQTTQRLLALLLEGRARVIALRSTGAGQMPLSEALRLIGEDHATNWPARFSVSVSGDEHPLAEGIQVAVIDILREAVHNAFVHAAPASVAVTLDYVDGGLVALVDDDGKGLPEDVRATGKRPGHWGLVTMRERAERVGATLSITSDAIGTSVSLIVPPPKPVRRRRARVAA
jgi:signal transduction histidine kinase/ligand-binding sensor domain-containing protein